MNFFERRKLKKAVHHLLHVAAHARHMRGDIADPEDLRRLIESEEAMRAAWKSRDKDACDRAGDALGAAIEKVYPTTRDSGWRENVEIFAVALAVAMAFRTYFFQPFKIPTNSMWPTLYGVTVPGASRDVFDTFPLSLVRLCVFGERYLEVTAKASGVPSDAVRLDDSYCIIYIDGIPHKMPIDAKCWTFQPGSRPQVAKGSILASGRRRFGDHIFVNRISYNLHPPRRGDIFVFSTVDLKNTQVHTNDFYIKRLVGMPNDTIHLRPPFMYANNEALTNGLFAKLFRKEDEYPGIGYDLPGDWEAALAPKNQPLKLSPTQYLPCGDNTRSSLDGRYFGAIEQKRIVGPACFVYWPFGKRWGILE